MYVVIDQALIYHTRIMHIHAYISSQYSFIVILQLYILVEVSFLLYKTSASNIEKMFRDLYVKVAVIQAFTIIETILI